MDCFLVLFTSPVRPIPKEFGKHHVPIGQSAVIVAADSMTTTKTILEDTPDQQDIGEIKSSIEAVKTLIAEKGSTTQTSIEAVKTLIAEKESAIQTSIESVKTTIAEKQTSALRWSIVALAAVVAALAGLIVALQAVK